MAGRLGWAVVVVLAASALSATGGATAAEKRAAAPAVAPAAVSGAVSNPANDKLVNELPAARAGQLAHVVGHWCIGTDTFLMGVAASGPASGNAYWSIRCTDGSTWAVQVDPEASVTAIDCASFKEAGAGKECFRKF